MGDHHGWDVLEGRGRECGKRRGRESGEQRGREGLEGGERGRREGDDRQGREGGERRERERREGEVRRGRGREGEDRRGREGEARRGREGEVRRGQEGEVRRGRDGGERRGREGVERRGREGWERRGREVGERRGERVLMVGDSLLKGLLVPPSTRVVALPGAQILDVVAAARAQLERRRWEVVLLACGSNNVWPRPKPRPSDNLQVPASGKAKAKHFAEHIRRLRSDFPRTVFAVAPVLPRQSHSGSGSYAQFRQFNSTLKLALSGLPRLLVADYAEEFVVAELFAVDGVHLCSAGRELLATRLAALGRAALRRYT